MHDDTNLCIGYIINVAARFESGDRVVTKMQPDVEQTIQITFQHLESVLRRGLNLSPVKNCHDLLVLLPESSAVARQIMLAELVKVDLSKAAEHDIARDLSFYSAILQADFPNGHLPLDLVLEEINGRRRRGDTVSISEYKTRFPHLASVLDDMITRVASTAAMPAGMPKLERAPAFADGAHIDDFTILRALGQGGFANVYLARQNSMQRLVALKVSHRGSDEPIALSQLDHPNIVRVFDQRALTDPPMILLYMQYIPGGTLAEVIRATAFLPAESLDGSAFLEALDRALVAADQQPPEHSGLRDRIANMDWAELVAWLGVALAEGLAAAHRAGIMHRDVKPANVLLSAECIPKLVDFNVSYSAVPGCAGAAVYFGGSLAYMSPEQLEIADPAGQRQAEDLDERSDIFSLAIVLWELWQGRRPVSPSQMFASWHDALTQQSKLHRQQPVVTRRFNSAAQRVLERSLRAALSFDRNQRTGSASELAGRLRLALLDRAAAMFEPAQGGLREKLLRAPVRWSTGAIIIAPNLIAGGLNYLYNQNSIATRHPDLESRFIKLSLLINLIAFPVGIAILIWLGKSVQVGLRSAAARQTVERYQLDSAWCLGHRAAMVGGVMWVIAGFAFPLVLHSWDSRFGWSDAIEFFLSLAICGGIAWIYPFFGVALLGTEVYYPAMVKPTMADETFPMLAAQMKRRANTYLASAAAIPLMALALLTLRQSSNPDANISLFLFTVLLLTAAALAFAFHAHQRLLRTMQDLASVLDETDKTI